jgi:hypothetical protein
MNRGVGSLLSFIGGGLGRLALSGILLGAFVLLFGMLPWQMVANLANYQPNSWFGPGLSVFLAVVGLALIAGSLWFNVWSRKQQAINELAEDISWAISDLLNRSPPPSTQPELQQLDADFQAWCAKINRQLGNRAFFTRADQLHFDRLGFIDPVKVGGHPMTGHPQYDQLMSMLRLKLERLRDVINWAQQRGR